MVHQSINSEINLRRKKTINQPEVADNNVIPLMNSHDTRKCRYRYSYAVSIILLMCISIITAQPRRGTLVFNGEFGSSFLWDGLGLQEKELTNANGFGIVIDSAGYIIDSGVLEYRHFEFGPVFDIAMYIFPRIALGAGYGYQWTNQFIKARHVLKNPGGSRLCTSHQVRGQFICSVYLRNFDEIDIIGIPFYTFGNVTRIPIALELFKDIVDAEDLEFLQEMHKPIAFKGYGFEIRVRGRHFFNNYFFIHGSLYTRIQKLDLEKDPFEDFLTNTPQGSVGIALGLGMMIGSNDRKKKNLINIENNQMKIIQ